MAPKQIPIKYGCMAPTREPFIGMVASGAVLAPLARLNCSPNGPKMGQVGLEGSDVSEWLSQHPKKLL